jgi:energy-coupling factor transporter ATP-binding protein EcfA2
LAHFVNDNAGVWGLMALPLMLLAVAVAAYPVLREVRVFFREDEANFAILRSRHMRLVEREMEQRLLLGHLLGLRLRAFKDGTSLNVEEFNRLLRSGTQAVVFGPAGAGKTTLALTMAALSSSRDETEALVEVVSVRHWKKPAFPTPNNWEHLVRWTARRLSRRYPSFGAPYFRSLIHSQSLILCFDGLDEMSPVARQDLIGVLRSLAKVGIPVVVFTRDQSVLDAEVSDLGKVFDYFELLPLTDDARTSLPDWQEWEECLANASQPERAAALLSNPLCLTIAAMTWAQHERPAALDRDGDPAEILWAAFFDRHLGPPGEESGGPSLRTGAARVALLASQRRLESFRSSDLYLTSRAAFPTLLICATPILVGSWRDHFLPFGLLTVVSIWLGLKPNGRLWSGRFAQTVNRHWSRRLRVKPMTMGLITLLTLTYVAGNVLESFFTLDAFTERGLAPLWRYPLASGALSYWVKWEVPVIVVVALIVAVLIVPFSFRIATSDLQTQLRFLVPQWMPRTLPPVASLVAVALGLFFGELIFVYFGTLILLPLVFTLTSRQILSRQDFFPAGGLDQLCRALARAGILYEHRGDYRFRHDEIFARLGMEGFEELIEKDELGSIPSPGVAVQFIDRRILEEPMETAGLLLERLAVHAPVDRSVIQERACFLYLGALTPEKALGPLLGYIQREPKTYLRIDAAEVLDAKGRRRQADELWEDIPVNQTAVAYHWAARQMLHGDRDAAMKRLKAWSRDREGMGPPSHYRFLLTEFQCRFGDEGELAEGISTLEVLSADSDRFLLYRAGLELARVWAELFGESTRAQELVERIWNRGEVGGLISARQAQLAQARGDLTRAEQFGREAFDSTEWDFAPPLHLEACVTAASFCPSLQEQAAERIEALLDFGWSLPGRPKSMLKDGACADEDLLDRVFPSPRIRHRRLTGS